MSAYDARGESLYLTTSYAAELTVPFVHRHGAPRPLDNMRNAMIVCRQIYHIRTSHNCSVSA